MAGELSIDASACAEKIRVLARDVPLEDVVAGLARAMGVRVVAKTSLPDLVSIDVSGAPEDVLKRLMHGKNLVVESKPSKACGSREVLATIWLLPAGTDAPRSTAAEQPRVEKAGAQPEFRSYASQPRPNVAPRTGRSRARHANEKVDPQTGNAVRIDGDSDAPAATEEPPDEDARKK